MVLSNSIRTLFLVCKPLYPPIGGAALRNWQNINAMMKYGPVAVVNIHPEPPPTPPETPPPNVAMVQDLVVGARPLRQKIGRRFNMVKWYFTQQEPLSDIHYSDAIATELDRLITKFQPDIIVFEEIWLYCYLFVFKRRSCKIIFDAHNAETFLFESLFANRSSSLKNRINEVIRVQLVRKIETRFITQADQVWSCSDRDAQLLQQLTPTQLRTVVVPNGIDVSSYEDVRRGNSCVPATLEPNPHTLIFPAAFSYLPNITAANLLLNEIFPKLQTLFPNCRLLLVGANPTGEMQAAAQANPGVIVTGKVPDVRPYLAIASVVIVPLRQGSGTRLKILEAFAAGRPVVSTTKGAEGLQAQDGVHLLIRDDVDAIVAGVKTLWTDAVLEHQLAIAAYQLVKSAYSWEAVGNQIDQAIHHLTPICLDRFSLNQPHMQLGISQSASPD